MTDARWLTLAAIMAAAALALSAVLSDAIGFPTAPNWAERGRFYPLVILAVATVRTCILLFRLRKSDQPATDLLTAFRASLPAFIALCLGAAILAYYFAGIGWLKSMLPFAIPFWADAPLAAFDSAVFGRTVIDIPGMGIFYSSWQIFHIGSLLYILHWRPSERKEQALSAFILTWAFGMVAAYLVSSAGPIFTGSPAPDEATRITASYLWENYQSGESNLGGGISAFPSMHVAVAVWFCFVFRRWFVYAYTVGICVGAVALGWHYSLDVPGGIAVALLGWLAARWILRWRLGVVKAKPAAA